MGQGEALANKGGPALIRDNLLGWGISIPDSGIGDPLLCPSISPSGPSPRTRYISEHQDRILSHTRPFWGKNGPLRILTTPERPCLAGVRPLLLASDFRERIRGMAGAHCAVAVLCPEGPIRSGA